MFLGIDQSLRSTGLAVVDAAGVSLFTGIITPGAKLKGTARLAHIRSGVQELFISYPAIQFAAIEGYSYGSAGRVFELGEVGAVIRMALHDAGVPFLVVSPSSLKKFVSGNGASKKEQMRQAVIKKWGVDLPQDDECDAFGLAQVARAVRLNRGTTRAELEVLKDLRSTDKKISLVALPSRVISI